MAKERETSPVVHRLRRIFGVAIGVLAVTAIAGFAFIATAAVPSVVIANACIAAASLTVVGGTGLAISVIAGHANLQNKRRKSRKYLKQISEIDNGKKRVSTKYRAKIVQKYAKLQLKLCQISKTPFTGVFHSISHMRSHKGTQALNELDALTLLAQTETDAKKVNAYNKKIAKKRALIMDESLRTTACKWTKSYDDVVKETQILDRRTEIACMHDVTVERFKAIANNLTSTDELGVNIIVNFKNENKYSSTYARISDKKKENNVTEILMLDIKKTCEGMTPMELAQVFPVTVESRKINKNNTNVKDNFRYIKSKEELDAFISELQSSSTMVK